MKVRQGFVSNSSSTSFSLSLHQITGQQLAQIRAWLEATNDRLNALRGHKVEGWSWYESYEKGTIWGSTETCSIAEAKELFEELEITDMVAWETT